MSKIFLLSPANTSGIRAKQFMSSRSNSDVVRMYRSPEGVPIALAYTYMSSLYFRGKIGYALHFADPPAGVDGTGIYVIAPGFGLVPPEWRVTQERMETLRKTPVDMKNRTYVRTLRNTAEELAAKLGRGTPVVLLGSVASGKYVDVLLPIFREQLRFPKLFAGLGDMSRGGLMLRAVRADKELEYTTLDAPRHRGPGGTGKMPLDW